MSRSETPESDQLRACDPQLGFWRAFDLARKFELENAALREDKVRLDWLDKHMIASVQLSDSEKDGYYVRLPKDKSPRTGPILSPKYVSLRAAIDAARRTGSGIAKSF